MKSEEQAAQEPEWTWGRVEIFGNRSHHGQYRWTPGERFLDVRELEIELKGGELIEHVTEHRYGAKAVFSVTAMPGEDVRELLRPYPPSSLPC